MWGDGQLLAPVVFPLEFMELVGSIQFWTKDHESAFVILDGNLIGDVRDIIARFKKNDTLRIYIRKSRLDDLSVENSEVPVYGISAEGKTLITPKEVNKNREAYSNRVGIFLAFFGVMFTLNGITLISFEKSIILAGIFLVIILAMKILRFGMY